MEKFTKEVVQASKQMFQDWFKRNDGVGNYNDYLDSLLKPETKYIDLRVEYNDSEFGMSAKAIQESLSNFDVRNEYVTKVTELPEVFSKEDIDSLVRYLDDHSLINDFVTLKDDWLSERNK